MPTSTREIHSNLFMVRVWLEEVDDSHVEWRGKVQRVVSGETLYFREWGSMLAFLRGDAIPDLPVEDAKEQSSEEGM
jgi:hypothetical protein